MPEFEYQELLPVGHHDDTPYRLLTTDGVSTLEAGGRRWVRWINPGQSYLCSSDPRAHFGLGAAERVDAIRVRWPDGTAELFAGLPADQPVMLRKGEGEADKATRRQGDGQRKE